MDGQPKVQFSVPSHRTLSTLVHLLGSSVLTFCLAHRIPRLGRGSWPLWANLTWARLCVILVLIDSWLFVIVSGLLVDGVGMSTSQATCSLGIYMCITFYALSKVLVYGFLVERVYIVWSGGNLTPRFQTPAYRICAIILLGYVTVLILMVVGQISLIRRDGMCIIGLKSYATIAMIVYDLCLNVFLTGAFLWPLMRSEVISTRLRRLARRTLFGATASLTTSVVNIVILTALKGEEYGWVCLASCVTDVSLNAIVLSWITDAPRLVNPMANRVSLPAMEFAPQSEVDQPPTMRLGRTTGGVDSPSAGPTVFFDYMPHQEFTSPEIASRTAENNDEGWLRNLVPGSKRRSGVCTRYKQSYQTAQTSVDLHEKTRTVVGSEPGCRSAGEREKDICDL